VDLGLLKKDMPELWQLGFQDGGSPTMEEIVVFFMMRLWIFI
jgi:hypothetical protein